MAQIISKTRGFFRARARLVSILGEHMISDHVVGLLELVKNSYDADADRVTVRVENTRDTAKTKISVQDDGFGMTALDVTEKFLSPAADHKAKAKKDNVRTPKGRLPIGEKGVGRFAVQHLGRQLSLVTRSKGQPEVVVEVDWDEFEKDGAFLDDVPFAVIEREPEVFRGEQTGTLIEIRKCRSSWDESGIRKLQRGLRRLQSPHVPDGKQGFSVSFECPEYPQLQNLDPTDILSHAHYTFRAIVDETGTMFYEYRCAHPGVAPKTKESELSLVNAATGDLTSDRPQCGPFYINLYVWDRTTEYLHKSGINRGDLDSMAGVSLFRDRLRVLPYGEPGDDWLRLDRDRINDPSRRIGNNQVIGFVEVDQANTPELRDKTNREGLIENAAFNDLRAMVRAGIAYFNTLWVQDRPEPKRSSGTVAPTVTQLREARRIASAIDSTASQNVSVRVPAVDVEASNQNGNESRRSDGETISQKQATGKLVSQIDQAIETDKAEEKEEKSKLEILLHLAATGMAAERVVHEFGQQIGPALAALRMLRAGRPASEGAINVLEACLGTLQNEFRALAPFEGANRLQKKTPVSVGESVKTALMLSQHALENARIDVQIKGDDFTVSARQASIIQIFDNLINNAVFWLGRIDTARSILIKLDEQQRQVLVADSGPGVPMDIRGIVFEPFVTTRAGGRGLGLYIVRALAELQGGDVELLNDSERELAGANFLVTFTDSKGDGRANQSR